MLSHCEIERNCEEQLSAECCYCEKPVCVEAWVRREGLVFCSVLCADRYETPLYTYPE